MIKPIKKRYYKVHDFLTPWISKLGPPSPFQKLPSAIRLTLFAKLNRRKSFRCPAIHQMNHN